MVGGWPVAGGRGPVGGFASGVGAEAGGFATMRWCPQPAIKPVEISAQKIAHLKDLRSILRPAYPKGRNTLTVFLALAFALSIEKL